MPIDEKPMPTVSQMAIARVSACSIKVVPMVVWCQVPLSSRKRHCQCWLSGLRNNRIRPSQMVR